MPLPSRIGRYRVVSLLGRGAMGVVYRGVDDSLDRPVAVKVMSKGTLADQDALVRFHREAQAVARLQHPNIVVIYELGEHEGLPFMALEFLEGSDLQRAIESGLRPDPKLGISVSLQVLLGLEHAHDHGIVHRDLKPSNIFLPYGRPAKIMDFGLARLGQGGSTTGVVGTPHYMSPEQARGTRVDARSDLFSVGLILYEVVTGEKAYQGDSLPSVLYKIVHEAPDLSSLPTSGPWASLRSILSRALARDPEGRYPDAASMRGDLTEVLAGFGGSSGWQTAPALLAPKASATMPQGPSEATPGPPATDLARPPAVDRARSRGGVFGRWQVGATVGALALVLAALGVLFGRHGGGPAPSSPAPPPSPLATPVAPLPSPSARSTRVERAVPPSLQASTASASPPSAPSPTLPTAPLQEPSVAPPVASVERANSLLEARRYPQALAEARAVLQRNPGDKEALAVAEEAEAALVIEESLAKAREALGRGDKTLAQEILRKGLAINANEARLLALWREATE